VSRRCYLPGLLKEKAGVGFQELRLPRRQFVTPARLAEADGFLT